MPDSLSPALAGANVTFGVLVVALPLGLSFTAPSDAVVRALKIVGADALRSAQRMRTDSREMPAVAKGSLAAAVLLLLGLGLIASGVLA